MILYFVAIFYGLMIGNFATSSYFRIPNNVPLNGLNNHIGKKPHCSKCHHELKFWEYLPLLSWFSTWGKCNYCKAAIDLTYICLEVGITFLSILLLYILGMNFNYVGGVLVGASVVLNLALYFKYKKTFKKGIGILLFTVIIYLILTNINV